MKINTFNLQLHFRTFSVSNPYSSANNNFVQLLIVLDKIK